MAYAVAIGCGFGFGCESDACSGRHSSGPCRNAVRSDRSNHIHETDVPYTVLTHAMSDYDRGPITSR
jgi:hypothetical protein